MNSAMWHVLERLSSGSVAMSNKFAMEQAMLVAILHHHVGSEVGKDRHAYIVCSLFQWGDASLYYRDHGVHYLGAYLTQCLVVALTKELDSTEPATTGKTAQSLVLLLTHLYNYKVGGYDQLCTHHSF